MNTIKFAVVIVVGAFAFGAHAQANCGTAGGLSFVCGPKNPEDLVQVPGTKWILSSGMADGAGFYLVDSESGAWSTLSFTAQHDRTFAGCPTPPDAGKLNTHGLNIRAAARGRAVLNVVGHGGREAIEVFDVDATGAKPTLTWKGCVTMPEGLAANSVASFADGSLVATVLLMPGKSFADSVAMRPTGAVFEWSPGKAGFELVRGSELPGNNGIEVSADGSEVYVVSSGFQTVVAFAHTNPTRQLRTTKRLTFTPDNVHMGADGKLLTAGMANDVPECGGTPGPEHDLSKLSQCPRGTIAAAIEPRTMEHSVIVSTPAIPTFSNATMVLAIGKNFWLGTFSGDRIGRGVLR
jgi:hypothetical protein